METRKDRNSNMTAMVQTLLEVISSSEMHWYSVIDFVKGKSNPLKPYPDNKIGFGSMSEQSPAFISNLMHFLLKESYIEFPESGKFTVGLTKRGKYCLKEQKPFYVNTYDIRRPWGSYMLEKCLLEERKKVAETRGIAVYEVVPRFVVETIAITMPKTEQEIKELAIWNEKYEVQWVLEAIDQFKNEWKNPVRVAAYPSYQETKALFCAGKNPDEMAELRKTKRERIIEQLIVLHRAKEIDLNNWAYTYYEKKKLDKSIHHFKTMKVKLLKPAHEMLKLDYEILKIGRLLAQTA